MIAMVKRWAGEVVKTATTMYTARNEKAVAELEKVVATLPPPPLIQTRAVRRHPQVVNREVSVTEILSATLIAQIVDCPEARAVVWHRAINLALKKYEITSKLRMAAFLSQIGHESARLSQLTENLNYSAVGLARTWPHRYAQDPKAQVKQPNELAVSLHRNPEKIANFTYANRMENGPPASGDGWRYRGRGPKQLTGRRNYRLYGAFSGLPVLTNPDLVLDREVGMDVAGWFWKTNNCEAPADKGDNTAVTFAINGGLNGLEERNSLYQHALNILT